MSVRVSLCVIAKNEEANLPACLGCAADLVDEIVVVDTGSTGRTKEVAHGLGARVFDFAWVDDFAAARNASLGHARGAWIFWLDADDRLDEANRGRLRALLAGLAQENAAYLMKCLCPTAGQPGSVYLDQVRLFPNDPHIRWRYRVHEQILPALELRGTTQQQTDIVIEHTGYCDEALLAGKHERNLRLLHRENEERPGDAFVLFNLAWCYQSLGRWAEADVYGRQSLERARPEQSFVRKLYAVLASVLRRLGRPAEALAFCRDGLARYPHDADLLVQHAWLLYLYGDYYGAEACLLACLQPGSPADGPAFEFAVDPGLRGYITRNNLAVLYRDQQRFAEAEHQWQAALQEKPDFSDALLGLGEIYLTQQRWPEVEQVLARLREKPKTALQADVLQAQQLMSLRDFAGARQLLGSTIAREPQALAPRLLLSRALWQEGQDWTATAQALREVLALDPNHAEARANLARLEQG
jgi:glycosyltransferase involved in cell wall biosynthesis/cytochrome c-type biogenesis protein CcmH/NrfG